MNPSPDAIEAIKAQVETMEGGWSSNDDDKIATALNDPVLDNATPAVQIPVVIAESSLAGLLTDPANGSLAKLLNWVNFSLVKADIVSQNIPGLMLWCQELALLGIMTSTEAQAVTAYVTSKEADPSWTAKTSWAQQNLGRLVDVEDVMAAREAQ